MQILLIEDPSRADSKLSELLRARSQDELIELSAIQKAIELLEVGGGRPDVIVCDYRGGSPALLTVLLSASMAIPCLVISEAGLPEKATLLKRDAILEVYPAKTAPAGLERLLKELDTDTPFAAVGDPDADYVRVNTKNLVLKKPLRADIYLRLAPGKYCKRFHQGDDFDSADLETHLRAKGIEAFYLHRDQASVLLELQDEALDFLDGDATAEEIRSGADTSLEVVHDVVVRLGFTPKVQELTKRTVGLVLRAVGSSPKLADILTRLRAHDGRYISSHSVMLAEVACAIAYRIGWSSSSLFMKLSLSAFLHDLTIEQNRIARFKTLQELEDAGLGPEELAAFRLHPIKAAEYALQLSGLPPDVDIILAQHHETPDGKGFPRGLHHHQLAPASCIFIIAHDLLHFFLDQVPTNDRGDMLRFFLASRRSKYAAGWSHKICVALESGTKIDFAES